MQEDVPKNFLGPRHPVVTKQFRASVGGHATDFLIALHGHQLVVFVSQLDVCGTVILAQQEKALDRGPSYSVSTLIGRRDEAVLTLCARGLVEQISQQGCNLPVLLFIGLKDHGDLSTAREVVSEVIKNKIW
mmetsp:Transcript_24412/g.58159  ORF Transcript_24412/g.58159 Transcript_24412/m.58159 type:complete len:132 (+) Transcript_24412:78-473(+)